MTGSFKIHDEHSLRDAAAFLHDAQFTRDDLAVNIQEGWFRLTGKVWMKRENDKPHAWYSFQLQFDNVVNCDVRITEDVEFYEIATIRMTDEHQITILGHYAVEISLQCSPVKATLQIADL